MVRPGRIASRHVSQSKMNTLDYGLIQIICGVGLILLAFVYRTKGWNASFRILVLVGYIGVLAGMIGCNLVNLWVGGTAFILWFVIALVFVRQERKERAGS